MFDEGAATFPCIVPLFRLINPIDTITGCEVKEFFQRGIGSFQSIYSSGDFHHSSRYGRVLVRNQTPGYDGIARNEICDDNVITDSCTSGANYGSKDAKYRYNDKCEVAFN